MEPRGLGILLLGCVVLVGFASEPPRQEAGARKEFEIVAERFQFTPDVIQVGQGDRVKITVRSTDSTHGFSIKKLGIKKEIPKGGEPVTIEFVANEAGSFQIACSEYCGNGHKHMKATLVVLPTSQQKSPVAVSKEATMNRQRAIHIGTGFAGATILAAAFVSACGGGGYKSSPTAPTTTSGGSGTATITLTSSGVSTKSLRIEPGQAVRFVNNDTRTHDMRSDPHPLHNACPAINNVGMLAAGASRDTGVFASTMSCGYHDNLNDADTGFRGSILVGTNEPAPPSPYGGSR